MLAVKNIIFDLGNVLYDIDFTKMYDEFKQLGVPDFESHYTLNKSDELFFNLEKGFINEHEFCEGFRKLMQLPTEDAKIIAAWNSLLIGFRKQSIDWVKANSAKYPTYLYSNTNKIHYDYFIEQFQREVDAVSFNTLFKKPYYSHEMGQRKPDPASFIYILEKEGLVAAETLFVDDNEPNIIAAASVGLQVLHLTEGMRIEKDILAYL